MYRSIGEFPNYDLIDAGFENPTFSYVAENHNHPVGIKGERIL